EVTHEVAGALARMRETAMSRPAAPPAQEVDVTAAPGIAAGVAGQLKDAGFGSLEALSEVEPGTLLDLGFEDFDHAQAEGLVNWAREEREKQAAELDLGPFQPAAEAPGGSMGDEDFRAALSRAFAESEQQRATAAGQEEEAEGEGAAEEAGLRSDESESEIFVGAQRIQ